MNSSAIWLSAKKNFFTKTEEYFKSAEKSLCFIKTNFFHTSQLAYSFDRAGNQLSNIFSTDFKFIVMA